MKNLIFTLILLTSFSIFSQESKADKVEAMKVGFITNKLELTAKEAQTFWPLYNEYNSKLEKLRKTKRSDFEELKNKSENLTDKELEAFINEVFSSKQKELDLQKEYYEKYAKVLPVKKVAMLYQAENQFKRELLRKIKEKK